MSGSSENTTLNSLETSVDNSTRKSLDNYYYYAKLIAVSRLQAKRKEIISVLEEHLRQYQEVHVEMLQLQAILNEMMKLSLETKALKEADEHVKREIEVGYKAISSISCILKHFGEKVTVPPQLFGEVGKVLDESKYSGMNAGNEYVRLLKELKEKANGNLAALREFVKEDVKNFVGQWSLVQDSDSD